MGAVQSSGIDPSHVRIYNNLLQFNDHYKRVQMLETLMMAPEYIATAKRTGLYGPFLNYIRAIRAGEAAYFPMVAAAQQQQQQPQQRVTMAATATGTAQARAQLLQSAQQTPHQQQIQNYQRPEVPAWQVVTQVPSAKALDYFQQCLNVLKISDEDSLTEESLKSAYKKAALRAHPDKGGSDQQFEAVTRAYAYLEEILRRIKGSRKVTNEVVSAPAALQHERSSESKKWEQIQPVRLDPKNLNMNAFNQLYEQTRIPDPEDDGYGDWLKDQAEARDAPKFSGKFNRDVFNKVFQDEASKKATQQQLILHPELMALNSSAAGVEIGRDKPQTYTAPANAELQYTDLRAAYTIENTISPHVANVRVEDRNLKDYKESYKKGPAQLTGQEQSLLEQQRLEREQYEKMRQRRAAQEDLNGQAFFERMKRLALTQ